MAFDTQSAAAPAKRLTDETGVLDRLDWGERVVTVVAASIALLIVATIAVLMGMT